MKKQDYVIFFLLVALLFAWPGIYQKFVADKLPPPPPAVAETETGEQAGVQEAGPAAKESVSAAATVEEKAITAVTDQPGEAAGVPAVEAVLVELSNAHVRLVVSSLGATVVEAELLNYREALPEESAPVLLDFRARPALAYTGIPGLSERSGFMVEPGGTSERILLSRRTDDGLLLRRELALGENYLVTVQDTFVNESGSSIELGQHEIRTGAIPQESAHHDMVGMIDMGVDSLPPAGAVENWGKGIPKEFRNEQEEQETARLPVEITYRPTRKPVDWVSAKNKYFVQILKADGDGADWAEIYARREVGLAEREGARVKQAVVEAVGAGLGFESQSMASGEQYTRTCEYYVGPKDYTILSSLSHARDAAMGFEENAYLDVIVVPTAKLLLRLLKFIHDNVWANYGVAIILLTVIVKVVFWPITHKGTESMRRMASVQPLMAEIREKHKDNPQKMQQAMMALYKEHKINPLGGCLPMLVQIPVFFALFVVLRISIELRFAEFLWIRDLSAPERLLEFGFTIPLLGWDALNILPLLMTATMVIQQRMTPTAGDPQQQKIMMIMMPAMMLFFLYNFASGLALYWTTQNILMIFQQLLYKQRKKRQEAAEA